MADDADNNRLAILIKPDDITDLGSSTDFLTTIRSWKIGLNEIMARKVLAVLGIGSVDVSPLLQYSGPLLSFLTETFREPEKLSLDPTKRILVTRFLSSSKIIVYIDGLDRLWESRREDVRRISALFNALRGISRENRGIYFKVSLRSDVYYLVRTSDESTDKIEGSVIWQSWNTHNILALLVKRIETFFERTVEEADLVAMKSSVLAPYLSSVMEQRFLGRGHWQNAPMHRVLMSLIRKRPRDLVKLCTLAARNARETSNTVIHTANFENVFQEYSQGRLQDTVTEFRSELPDLARLLMNMRPTRKERTAREGYVYSTDSLIKKIHNIQETDAFRFANGSTATDKELAAFMYKINFLTARKETSGEIIRSYFEENRYLSNEFIDFGFHWEIHPAYRWVLQPESAYDIFNELALSADL
jgi:hypothetical protein